MTELLLTEEELMLRNLVREFADSELAPRAAGYDETAEFPWENMRGLAAIGLLGLGIDEEYGGSGGSTRQLVIAVEEISRGCAATATVLGAHLSLCTQYINMFGTDGQKREFIPPLVAGEQIGAFALTEPGAGSDAAAMTTTGTRSNGGYVLNGAKTFITNAPEASTMVVMATQDRSMGSRGINSFILECDTPGITINPLHGKMGIRASSAAEVVFEDCPVPDENRMGNEGEGFRMTMEVLNASRMAIAAQCVGIAQASYDAALAYVSRNGKRSDRSSLSSRACNGTSWIWRPASRPPACSRSRRPLSRTRVARSSPRRRWRSCTAPGWPSSAPTRQYRCTAESATSRPPTSSVTTATPRSRRSTRARQKSSVSSSPATC